MTRARARAQISIAILFAFALELLLLMIGLGKKCLRRPNPQSTRLAAATESRGQNHASPPPSRRGRGA